MIVKLFRALIDALTPVLEHFGEGVRSFYASFAVVSSTIQGVISVFPLLPAFITSLVSIGIFICVANIVLKVI